MHLEARALLAPLKFGFFSGESSRIPPFLITVGYDFELMWVGVTLYRIPQVACGERWTVCRVKGRPPSIIGRQF